MVSFPNWLKTELVCENFDSNFCEVQNDYFIERQIPFQQTAYNTYRMFCTIWFKSKTVWIIVTFIFAIFKADAACYQFSRNIGFPSFNFAFFWKERNYIENAFWKIQVIKKQELITKLSLEIIDLTAFKLIGAIITV